MSECPLVSMVVLAYNQERFIREAVSGAFSQNYSPLEIVLSDDCSTDGTYEIIREMASVYNGPHKIVVNRNEKNLGIAMHFNKVMELASGEIIAVAAGDDISLGSRITDTAQIFSKYPHLSCVSLKLITFRSDPPTPIPQGRQAVSIHFVDLDEYLSCEGGVLAGASRAFRRTIHDFFGPITFNAPSEDTATLFRCLLYGPGAELSKAGVLYRIHGNNAWSSVNKFRTSIPSLFEELKSSLVTALHKGLIDLETCCSLHDKVKRRMGKLSAVLEMEQSGHSVLSFIRYYLASPNFTFRQKIGRLCRFIRSRKCK